jgi:hypothetical protein
MALTVEERPASHVPAPAVTVASLARDWGSSDPARIVASGDLAARDLDAMVQFIGTAFPDFKVRGQGVNFQGNRRWAICTPPVTRCRRLADFSVVVGAMVGALDLGDLGPVRKRP